MNLKSSALFIRYFVVVVAIAVASPPMVRNLDDGRASAANQPRADQPTSAPIVVAQGRCYNGRCY